MPTQVVAKEGDTLCTLAMEAGFLDCQPLRDDPANADFLKRDLAAGDVVTVPDLEKKEDDGQIETTNVFVAQNSPPVRITFVHGSPDKKYLLDDELTVLNVSNYRTDKAGKNALSPLPKGFGFNPDGHADPDTFKVQVVDPKAPGKEVVVQLDPLVPIYDDKGNVTGHRELARGNIRFPAADFRCEIVSSKVAFRTRYLRLVTDRFDMFPPDGKTDGGKLESIDGQALMLFSGADGTGADKPGDRDFTEILDQLVRASYTIQRCPAAAPFKCTVRKSLPVAERSERLTVRVVVHIFRATKNTGKVGIDGITEPNVRRRVYNHVRNFFAQANMTPKLVAPFVDFVDPPPDNMLVIGQDTGKEASGKTSTGASSSLLVTIFNDSLPFGSKIVTVNLTKGMKPVEVGNALKAGLPGGISAEVFENVRNFSAKNGSCDVLITADDGSEVTLGVSTDDTGLKKDAAVARVNLNRVDTAVKDGSVITSTMDLRRILRAAPGTGNRIDVYVAGAVLTTAEGITFIPGNELKDGFRPSAPMKNAVVMRSTGMDGSDTNADVLPHEMGHALTDGFHVTSGEAHHATELMSGDPEQDSLNVDKAKRISDRPVLVSYDLFDARQLTPGQAKSERISGVEHFRTRDPEVLQ